jgi:hypothetical protein
MLSNRLRGIKIISVAAFMTLSVLILAGCKKEAGDGGSGGATGTKELAAVAVALRQDDGFLSKEDIDSLKKVALESKTGKISKWINSDGQVNPDSLAGFLVKDLQNKGIEIKKEDILNPVSEQFNVNFFVENSSSMEGYIAVGTGFREALFGLLGDLKASFPKSVFKLHFINKVITHSVSYESDNDVLEKFIHRITVPEFARLGKMNGGNRGSTDVDDQLGQILKEVDKNNLAIVVSDFIFSPGNRKDAEDYLAAQSGSIRLKFSQKMREQNLAVLILKMESDFKGVYYDKSDRPINYAGKRPYYIWFIGTPLHIAKIVREKVYMVTLKNNGFGGDYMVMESFAEGRQAEFKIVPSERYTFSNKERKIKAKLAKGKFTFKLDVAFCDAFRDSAYFADPGNYKVNNPVGYELTVEGSKEKDKNYKHRLVLSAEKIIKGDVKITTIGKMPKWVDAVNSADDSNIKRDESEHGKTYGFKRLVSGVYSAFFPGISVDESYPLQTINLSVQLED